MPRGKSQLQRIDIDELFDNSSNRGMLSFLERPPEEAESRLREKRRVNEADNHRLDSGSELPPVGKLPSGSFSHEPVALPFPRPLSPDAGPVDKKKPRNPISDLPPDVSYTLVTSPLAATPFSSQIDVWNQAETRNSPPGVSYPGGVLTNQPGSLDHPPVSNTEATYPEGKSHPPVGDSQPGVTYPVGALPNRLGNVDNTPQTFSNIVATHPEGKLPTGPYVMDGAILGRRQKIRRAYVAQDGHSSGEQLLYQSLWNAGRSETTETRLIAIGYNGMSSLCKLEKSNCKKNIQSLMEKLAVEVTGAYHSASSTGTTYRVFSYKEILRRREAAGLIWVIRTSGVRFVDPAGNSPPAPLGDLHSGPGSNVPIGSGGKTITPPVGKTHTPLGKERTNEGITSSSAVHQALVQYGVVDDDVCSQLIVKCRQATSDCTDEEIISYIHEKGRLLRSGTIRNPMGFFLESVPKCLASKQYRDWRQAKKDAAAEAAAADAKLLAEHQKRKADYEACLNDPNVPESEKLFIRRVLGAGK